MPRDIEDRLLDVEKLMERVQTQLSEIIKQQTDSKVDLKEAFKEIVDNFNKRVEGLLGNIDNLTKKVENLGDRVKESDKDSWVVSWGKDLIKLVVFTVAAAAIGYIIVTKK